MNPIDEQIELLVKLAPEAKTVGVLYASNEDNSILQAKIAKEAIEKRGLTYVEVTVSSSNEVQQATQSIVDICDAIYIPTDNVFASAMPLVHGVTSQSKTPVIVGEAGMCESGGLATLGINYRDLGYQTGLMAVKLLKVKPNQPQCLLRLQINLIILLTALLQRHWPRDSGRFKRVCCILRINIKTGITVFPV